jgi:hypothetical protein
LNGATYDVEQWNASSNTWTAISGPAADVYAGASSVYLTNFNADEEKYTGTPGHWNVIAGPTTQFAASSTNLYSLGSDNAYVALHSGSGECVVRDRRTGRGLLRRA